MTPAWIPRGCKGGVGFVVGGSVEVVSGFEAGRIREVIPGRFRWRGGEFDGERDLERLRFVAAGGDASGAFVDTFPTASRGAFADTFHGAFVGGFSVDFIDASTDSEVGVDGAAFAGNGPFGRVVADAASTGFSAAAGSVTGSNSFVAAPDVLASDISLVGTQLVVQL